VTYAQEIARLGDNDRELSEEQKRLIDDIATRFECVESPFDMGILYEVTGYRDVAEGDQQAFAFWEDFDDNTSIDQL